MSKRKGEEQEQGTEKKPLLAMEHIDIAIRQQGAMLKDFITIRVIDPLKTYCPTVTVFKCGEGGWQLDLTITQREYQIKCMSLPSMRVSENETTAPIGRNYDPLLQVAGPHLGGIVEGTADVVIPKVQAAFQQVKPVLAEVYELIMDARFWCMYACPVRSALVRDGYLQDEDWMGIFALANNDSFVAPENWIKPQSDQELLDQAIQFRKDAYALEMKRLGVAQLIEEKLTPFSADWNFEVAYKLRQSVAGSHNYHLHDSPLTYDTWEDVKDAFYRKFCSSSPLEYAATPNFEEEYAKRKPELYKEGEQLEAELQAALTKARMN